jgi:molecular chaperone GrpE
MPNSPESRPPENLERAEHQEVAETDELTAELARLEDRYKRALADLDNYRKRCSQEIERRVADAKEAVISDWLEAVDSVERAIRMEPAGPCLEGLRAVLDQMGAVLARQGAVRIGAAGDRFDPERHEAVAVQPSEEVPDRTILSVERSGFALGDRVIRPAQVVVARAPEHVR